jgi:putative endonuclease
MRGFFIMVTVYIIESLVDGVWYTGMAFDALHRLAEHNAGKNIYTKGHRPWKIIYTENHPDWKAARVRENYFKTAAGKNWIRKKLSGGDAGSLPA